MLKESYRLYRDDQGRLRKTKTGQYRFDLILRNEDDSMHSYVMGYRFDYAMKRILPITLPRGTSIYVVAEIAPGSHDRLAEEIYHVIERELEDERVALKS